MSERQLQNLIVLFAKRLGLLIFHNYDGYRVTDTGWLDLTICGPGGFAVRELKRNITGYVVPINQLRWIRLLRGAGIDVGVWTEDDWHCGRIQQELERLAFPQAEAA